MNPIVCFPRELCASALGVEGEKEKAVLFEGQVSFEFG